jgi:hypothetical protein
VTVSGTKFSQIVPASTAALTDTLIGVQGGTTDVQYRIEDLIPYIPTPGLVTYYVATTGSDSNPGTIGSPFATIQHALNQAGLFNYEGQFWPTIFVADGTYSGPVGQAGIQIPLLYSVDNRTQPARLIGNLANPANCVINFTSASAGFVSNFLSTIWIGGFTLNNSGDNFVIAAGEVDVDAMIINLQNFNATGFQARGSGLIVIGWTTFTMTVSSVTGAATFMIFGKEGGQFIDQSTAWTMSNACVFGDVVSAGGNSNIDWLDGGGFWASGKSNIMGPQFFIADNATYSENDGVPDGSRASLPGSSIGRLQGAATIGNDDHYDIVIPVNGATVTMWAVGHQLIINPAGPLATLTVILPTYACHGDTTRISTTQTITALTVSAAATFGITPTVLGTPSTLAAGGAFQMIYDATTTTWYPS